jgi:hypothetical protein
MKSHDPPQGTFLLAEKKNYNLSNSSVLVFTFPRSSKAADCIFFFYLFIYEGCSISNTREKGCSYLLLQHKCPTEQGITDKAPYFYT